MAEEQVLRSEPPPPPSKANDNKSSGGRGGEPPFEKFVFWMERVAAYLVISCWVPSNPWHFLFPAIALLTISNFLYCIYYIERDKNGTDKEKIEQEKAKLDFSLNESTEEVKAKDGRNKMDEENTGQEKASLKESKEEVKPKDEGNDKTDEENNGQKEAEPEAKDERNNIDEETTGQLAGWQLKLLWRKSRNSKLI
ncbi:hypothetical protein RHGRI_013363 [Rhododendron griersonianum]|uniref:Transmembrane protein n=1 Tax=Rhododendron griersonianum TaxID=479676 RepID=A0AAV6K592_9ERIC|nr:hypothetical protein RHGRI_013363 [Rhododendron griersonianum]